MKKYLKILFVFICLMLLAIFLASAKVVVPMEFQNMVDASVLISSTSGRGSGVFIEDNVVLTAAHLLKKGGVYRIELRDGTILESSNFYIDTEEDIGFIFVRGEELHIATVTSHTMNLGDTVYLVGAPFDGSFKFTLTKGIVSHLSRDFYEWKWKDLLQVDAEGGPGCSGGPLYDSDGNIIGIYVGQVGGGGRGISLCESAKSILEAYRRCKDAINQ